MNYLQNQLESKSRKILQLEEKVAQASIELERLTYYYERLAVLEREIERLTRINEIFRLGLIRIVQMERMPASEETRPDDITQTGAFANDVLHGRWP